MMCRLCLPNTTLEQHMKYFKRSGMKGTDIVKMILDNHVYKHLKTEVVSTGNPLHFLSVIDPKFVDVHNHRTDSPLSLEPGDTNVP